MCKPNTVHTYSDTGTAAILLTWDRFYLPVHEVLSTCLSGSSLGKVRRGEVSICSALGRTGVASDARVGTRAAEVLRTGTVAV